MANQFDLPDSVLLTHKVSANRSEQISNIRFHFHGEYCGESKKWKPARARGRPIISHRKHSGIQAAEENTRVRGCTIYMRSFKQGVYRNRDRATEQLLTFTSFLGALHHLGGDGI